VRRVASSGVDHDQTSWLTLTFVRLWGGIVNA
jgi:hypothetical protein